MTSIAVSSPFRFHMFALAGQLEKANALGALYSALPSRKIPEISNAHLVETCRVAGGLRLASGSLHLQDVRLARYIIEAFDRWQQRVLQDHDVVTFLSGFSSNSMLLARNRGIHAICDRGSQHILQQIEIVRREHRKLGLDPPEFDRAPRYLDYIINRELAEYEASSAIVVPSHAARASFIREQVSAEKVHVIPYGADLTMFRPSTTEGRNLSQAICVGAIGPRKGYHYLMAAYRKARIQDSSLKLVGKAPTRQYRNVLGDLPPGVLQTGTLSREGVADAMRKSGFFVLASVEEGLPLVILQAMASGLPVIATESTGGADIISDGHDGFIVADGDVDALGEAMSKLFESPDLVLRMGANARQKLQSLEGWRRHMDGYLKLARGLMGRHQDSEQGKFFQG